MLKKMSIALLAASILAAPALAAGSGKTFAAAKPDRTATMQVKHQANTTEAKSIAGKPHLNKVARHHRAKYRHYAHRHHKKVSTMHASATSHTKSRLGLNKSAHKVSVNNIKKTGAKLSFKHVRSATRRG